jgi:hypothetical protein
MRIAYRVLGLKPEGKRRLGISMLIGKDNIEMGLNEIGGFSLDSCGSR